MSSIHVTNVKDASGNAALVTESGGVKTDKLTGISTAGSISVVAEGGSTTTNLQQGLIKVWADYSGGGTPVAADSFNCSTITDVSTGRKNQAFTNNMRSANFFVIDGMIADGNSGSTRGGASHHFYTQASSSIEYAAMYGSTSASNGNFTDSHTVDGCGVAGDLA